MSILPCDRALRFAPLVVVAITFAWILPPANEAEPVTLFAINAVLEGVCRRLYGALE
jgi:hypothetical protein